MAGTVQESQTAVVSELNNEQERVVLRLRDKAQSIPSSLPNNTNAQRVINETRDYWERRLDEESREMRDLPASREATDVNKTRLNKRFNMMREKLNQQQKDAEKAMENMTEQEQEEFLEFWTSFGKFFMDMFEWLSDFTYTVIKKIKEGFKIVKTFLEDLFKKIVSIVRSICGD